MDHLLLPKAGSNIPLRRSSFQMRDNKAAVNDDFWEMGSDESVDLSELSLEEELSNNE